jgi:hypothetical protein
VGCGGVCFFTSSHGRACFCYLLYSCA